MTFAELFTARIKPLLANQQFPQAIEALESSFASLGSPFERSEAYHWLGMIQTVLASQAMGARDLAVARDCYALAEEFLLKALDEYPHRPNTRVTLSRYYLSPAGQPERAFPLLEPCEVDAEHQLDEDVALYYEHQRLVLRGVVLGLIGSVDEAQDDLLAAYGGSFPTLGVARLDVMSMMHLAAARVVMPEGFAERLGNALVSAGMDAERAGEVARRLA